MPKLAPGVTAALIVRDEEHFLAGCLSSLKDCVDAIVVVDTGSTDSTVAIAKAAGARVFSFEWIGDFSAARNAALDRVTTTWTLYIDADERVIVPSNLRIADTLDIGAHAGGYVRFRPRPGYTRYRELRLFRSDPVIRFQGAIHETMLPDVFDFAAEHCLAIPNTAVCIDHYGFEGDQRHKVRRNLPLLEAEILAHPQRAYCWHHLAEMLVLDGREKEAMAVCRRGLAATRHCVVPKRRADRRQIAKTLARLLIESGADALEVIDPVLQEDPGDFATLYLKGRALLLAGDSDGTILIARRLTEVDPDRLDDSLTAYDRRLFGEFAWALLGAALFQADQRQEAGEAYKQAWVNAPGEIAYLAKAAALGADVSDRSAR